VSNIKYGLISEVDKNVLEKTLDLICDEFKNDLPICITEIGVYSGLTGQAMCKYIGLIKNRYFFYTGVDNGKDGQELKDFQSFNSKLIIGNSNEVYNQLQDNSQHLIFVDGCHCFAHVISDFFCYAEKVKVGGYFAFHDTGKHIKEFKDFQHGDKNNPDAYISVRKALNKIGLFDFVNDGIDMKYSYMEVVNSEIQNWQLIFDEADSSNEAGGICVFKKLY
jgi:hypothetical protein